jgi:hypothetical protein
MPTNRLLAGGLPNPNFRTRSGSRKGDRRLLVDGSPNPDYRPRSGHHSRDHRLLPDGSQNPNYKPRSGRISKFQRGEFIAWDGEGINTETRTEEHRYDGRLNKVEITNQDYVLLASSNGNHTYDATGIDTNQALEFVIQEAQQHPHAIHTIYGATYDFEMWLKDLPTWMLRWLNEGEWVRFGDYKLLYRPRRSLYVGHVDPETGARSSVVIFDVIGFFQASFLEAIDKWCPNHPDRELIHSGKAERTNFGESDQDFLINYNAAELRALTDLMREFHAAVKETGYTLRRFDGAGALAAAMMLKHDVRRHMARRVVEEDGIKHDEETVPLPVREAALRAMAGGRIECLKIGHHPHPVWHGDINSAYPHALLELPSLADGTWKHHHTAPTKLERYALYHVTWDIFREDPLYPFFFRDPHGNISFPPNGEGWYWGPEVIAATRHHAIGITIHEWFEFKPATADRPFTFVTQETDRRFHFQRIGHAAEIPMKLGTNSLYGKTAQQKGTRYTQDGRLLVPRYYQPEWAGYVTSACRAEVYDTAMQDPGAVIMIATDGIYSTRPLAVNQGCGLGEWKTETHAWMLSVQSGVYFTEHHGQARACYRGFDRESITPDRILAAWTAGERSLQCTTNRFVTLGAALKSRTPLNKVWRAWRRAPRTLRLDGHGTKRTQLSESELRAAATGLVDTRPIPNPLTGECSTPPGSPGTSRRHPQQSEDFVDTTLHLEASPRVWRRRRRAVTGGGGCPPPPALVTRRLGRCCVGPSARRRHP